MEEEPLSGEVGDAGPARRRDLITLLCVAAIGWPHALRAQQKAIPVIGWLNGTSPEAAEPLLAAFRQGLNEAGWVEGQSVAIEYRWAEGHYDRLPGLAADLVGRKVDVIATSGGDRSARAAKDATATIPIVATIGGDPVETGLVASLSRPGGNLTGISFLTADLMPKRLELICDLVQQSRAVALLVNPNSPQAERVIREMQEAAAVKAVQLKILRAGTEGEIDAAFAALPELQTGALVVQADPFLNARREQLVALTTRYAIPAIYEWRGIVAAGGLISYGTSLSGVYRQVGSYVGQILKGAKPADLPVQQPTTFELVINLNTAKALGLTIPQTILLRADEVID
jgi:putative ABC transport system substrate-binding protein